MEPRLPVPQMWMLLEAQGYTSESASKLGPSFICPLWKFSQQVLCHFLSTWQYHITFAAAPRFCRESTDRRSRSCIWEVLFLTVPLGKITVDFVIAVSMSYSPRLEACSLTHKLLNHNFHKRLIPLLTAGQVQNILAQCGPPDRATSMWSSLTGRH